MVAERPSTYRAFDRRATSSKLTAERWWHSSDDQVTVIADEIVDLTAAHEALDQGDVDAPRWLALAAADGANAGIVHR